MKLKTKQVIECSGWDKLVKDTYGKPYCFQQQDGCQPRGMFEFTVPSEDTGDDELPESIKEECNGPDMGVKFKAWLARNPKQKLAHDDEVKEEQWAIDLWWDRNFYPDFQTLANDLHAKGLLESGEYTIAIDW